MMIPEAWENNAEMDPAQRAFYRFHSSVMEPWDGPASVDVHRRHGDRRRARPQRPAPEPLLGHRRRPRRDGVRGRRHRHRPGQGRHQGPPAAGPHVPHRHGAGPHRRRRGDQDDARRRAPVRRVARARASSSSTTCRRASTSCSATTACCAASSCSATPTRSSRSSSPRWPPKGTEPIGSMGTDTPIAVLSDAAAAAVRLLRAAVRPGHEPAARRHPRGGRHVGVVDGRPGGQPAAAGPGELPPARAAVPDHRQRRAGQDRPRQRRRRGSPACGRTSSRASTASPAAGSRSSGRSPAICCEVSAAIDDGARIIVLSDRNADAVEAPIPSLLLTAAVHHHLVRTKQRTMVGLLVECGDAREVHHMALLIGYGAGAINPYLAFESIEDLIAERHARARRDGPGQGGAQLHQGVRQGRAQGDVEDGRLDGRQLHRRPDLRGHRARRGARRAVLHGHRQPARRHRARRDRRRGRRPPRHGPPDPARGAGPPQARARRRVPVAARGRAPPVQPGDGVQAAARHPGQALRHLQAVLARSSTTSRKRLATLRGLFEFKLGERQPVPIDEVEPVAVDRAPLLDRRDELRVDLGRGPRDAGHRDEPDRRQVEHRRGRRGRRPAARPGAPVGDQAGGVGALRRDVRVPHERRRPADQDGPGRQARRGRPAARATRCTRGSPRPGTRRRASA